MKRVKMKPVMAWVVVGERGLASPILRTRRLAEIALELTFPRGDFRIARVRITEVTP